MSVSQALIGASFGRLRRHRSSGKPLAGGGPQKGVRASESDARYSMRPAFEKWALKSKRSLGSARVLVCSWFMVAAAELRPT